MAGARLCGGVDRFLVVVVSLGTKGSLKGFSLGVKLPLREDGTKGAHSGFKTVFFAFPSNFALLGDGIVADPVGGSTAGGSCGEESGGEVSPFFIFATA